MSPIIIGLIVSVGGSILNFIGTKIYNKMSGASKNFFWRNSEEPLKKIMSLVDLDDLKKRVRIVVIDDEEGFPIKLFKSEGYAIDKWDKVTDVSYGKLEQGFYDIIVLDIQGVAKDLSIDDGLGVLESIKKRNPAQIIIAYSQHSYDLNKNKFWEMADETIAKPSDFLKIKGTIDDLISREFKIERYIGTLHNVLKSGGLNNYQIREVDTEILKIVNNKKQPNWSNAFSFLRDNRELINQVISISGTILKFFNK